MKVFISLIALVLLTSTCLCQSRQPTNTKPITTQTAVTKDGRTVILKSDGTWEYVKVSPATIDSCELSIEVGLVYQSGDVKPVARCDFYLLDMDLVDILKAAQLKPPKRYKHGTAELDRVLKAEPVKEYPLEQELLMAFGMAQTINRMPEYQAFLVKSLAAIETHIIKRATTDFSGKAVFEGLSEKSCFIVGVAKTVDGYAVWNIRKSLAGKSEKLLLDQNNAAVAK